MTLLLHLVEALVITFLLFSYLACGYVAFIHVDERIKSTALSMRFFLWLLSPLVVLDILAEKIFGRSLLS